MNSNQKLAGLVESLIVLAQHRPGCALLNSGSGATCDCPYVEIIDEGAMVRALVTPPPQARLFVRARVR